MHKSLLDILVDPISKAQLQVEASRCDAQGNVIEGKLHSSSHNSSEGKSYLITNGIPRFVLTEDHDQRQTENSFGFKWRQRDTYNSPQMHANAQAWLVGRYGFATFEEMQSFFSRRRRIFDAGCGGGFSAGLWMDSSWRGATWVGADISEAIDVAQDRLRVQDAQDAHNIHDGKHFIQADLLQLPFAQNTFDTIFSEGVLHHTPSTELALKSLVAVLEPGGELMFYVYRKKGAIREFADDYIRQVVSSLSPEEAWAALRPLTKLGHALAELHAEIDVPEDIPYLDIKAGRYDVQRLIYWHFAKMFWNEAYSFEENNHINFDWYHPRYAHRQTAEDMYRWCDEANLTITHFNTEESGFTVRAIKN